MGVRDSQRSKVYKAQWASVANYKTALGDLEAVGKFVRRVCRSDWWREHALYPNEEVKIGDGRGARNAFARQVLNQIVLPKWARTDATVLHELSHLTVSTYKPAHGPEFCANYLQLVRKYMGSEPADALKQQFKLCGCKVAGFGAGRPSEMVWEPVVERVSTAL